MVRLLGTTWGRPAGIEAGQDHDRLSEATGQKAQPGVGQFEYSTSYGAKSHRPHANCNDHAKTFEATGWVALVIQFLLLGFHTDGLLADGDGALRKALSKYGMPQEQLPEIHLCLNHWFRSFKKPLYKLKGATAAGLRGICTEPQIARLGYNINCAARTVLTAVEKEPEDFTPENYVVFRERVLVGPLQHSIGANDKCDGFHPNLKEVCPTAAQRWCPGQIQAAMREAGCSEAEIDTARKEAEEQCEVPDRWHDCNLAA